MNEAIFDEEEFPFSPQPDNDFQLIYHRLNNIDGLTLTLSRVPPYTHSTRMVWRKVSGIPYGRTKKVRTNKLCINEIRVFGTPGINNDIPEDVVIVDRITRALGPDQEFNQEGTSMIMRYDFLRALGVDDKPPSWIRAEQTNIFVLKKEYNNKAFREKQDYMRRELSVYELFGRVTL